MTTLQAIQGSIEKWEGIVAGTEVDKGTDNCPLCEKYYRKRWLECTGCPVKLKVKAELCESTPYDNWLKHQHDKHAGGLYREMECPYCKRLAKKELVFLKSLLP